MHEGTLMRDLMRKIESVAKVEGATRVTGVKVALGALSHMSEEHFREHFEASSQGTIAQGARLDVTVRTDTRDPEAQNILLESVDVG